MERTATAETADMPPGIYQNMVSSVAGIFLPQQTLSTLGEARQRGGVLGKIQCLLAPNLSHYSRTPQVPTILRLLLTTEGLYLEQCVRLVLQEEAVSPQGRTE